MILYYRRITAPVAKQIANAALAPKEPTINVVLRSVTFTVPSVSAWGKNETKTTYLPQGVGSSWSAAELDIGVPWLVTSLFVLGKQPRDNFVSLGTTMGILRQGIIDHRSPPTQDAKRRARVGVTWPNSWKSIVRLHPRRAGGCRIGIDQLSYCTQRVRISCDSGGRSCPLFHRSAARWYFSCNTARTKYVRVQHNFTVPLQTQETVTDPNDDTVIRMWYVSASFEVICVADQAEDDDDTHDAPPRKRPLLAVDLDHAVWLEHVRAADEDENEEPYERRQKRFRFVSFPGVRFEGEDHAVRSGIAGGGGLDGPFEMEGATRTLAIPKELVVVSMSRIARR